MLEQRDTIGKILQHYGVPDPDLKIELQDYMMDFWRDAKEAQEVRCTACEGHGYLYTTKYFGDNDIAKIQEKCLVCSGSGNADHLYPAYKISKQRLMILEHCRSHPFRWFIWDICRKYLPFGKSIKPPWVRDISHDRQPE